MAQKSSRSSLVYLLVAALLFAFVYNTFFIDAGSKQVEDVSITTLQSLYSEGKIVKLETEGNVITATLNQDVTSGDETYTKDTLLKSVKSPQDTITELGFYEKSSVEVSNTDPAANAIWYEIVLSIVPFFLLIGFLFLMMRSVSSNNRTAMSFGNSKAKEFDKNKKNKVTFDDVAGSENAKEGLEEIVDFLKSPKKYLKMGAKIPRGVLLFGPPGTGKTLLARAVAGEADVPFFSISGSEFVEMFVGVGASRVRDLFAKARKNAPCIIFVDEIDAVGRHRGTGVGGGHDEREQTLNQILTEMDGFENDTNVIVMAATNRPDVLDPALLRPGRFDRRVTVDNPDLTDREAILKVHARSKPLAKNTDLKVVAQHTPGFSGADLENVLNESAIKAARENKKEIEQTDLSESLERVLLGPQRRNKIMSDDEVKITAYHEVGHAITGYMMKHTDPVHKISIVSRGRALGVTWFLPEKDEVLTSKEKFEDELVSLMGGRAAEELMFGTNSVTTGASNDMEKATKTARNMVTKYGMSALGPVVFGEHHAQPFLGKDVGHERTYSEQTAQEIDTKVSEILKKAYKLSLDTLTKNKKMLVKIAEDLIKKESLSRKEFEAYFSK
ncbi:MAG: ATP-dependent zinc metalloprotease FtsH [Candidatus Gracilibacteria bacterium]|nr:ATP-dependent zinc metalloprotease FtsH [Candidatus Gracilibacteria bacterium]